jgi:type VI secretion system protein ImpJ
MSASSKVVWSEGLFLQPQHFQQQERYLERYVELRCHALASNSWGLTDVEIEPDYLSIGKFGLRRAAGVFPDGTPARMPEDDPLPEPIDVAADVRDQIVHLAVPMRRAGAQEIARASEANGLVRHRAREVEARDATSPSGAVTTVEIGSLRTRFVLDSGVTSAYACIPLAFIVERRADGRVVLDDKFIPTVLHANAASRLAGFTRDLRGRLNQRGDALAGRIAVSGRGGSAEVVKFLMLQAINRNQPVVEHFTGSAMHPEELFQFCVSMAGEFATFSAPSKRIASFPVYRHDRLRETFEPVIAALEYSLDAEIEDVAIPIPIEHRQYGIWLARVADRALLSEAVFVLAVHADVPPDELRRRVAAQLKVGPPERIQEIVTRQLRAVPVEVLPTAPRQIPFHAGFTYFQFDQTHELWKELKTSGSIAMFLGELPGLTIEFWAIRA